MAQREWAKRRKRGSCIICKKKKLVHVCLKPIKCLVCRECYTKNKGPCFLKDKVLPKHVWQTTEATDVGDKIKPTNIPDNAWFYCLQCQEILV